MTIGLDISNLHSLNKTRGVGFYTDHLYEALKKYTPEQVVLIEGSNSKPKVDLIHYPFFDPFMMTLPLIKNHPTVVTIHDVIPLLFPQHYPSGIKGKVKHSIQKIALKNVQAFITDSECSKKDIVKVLGISPKKVFVTYLAPAEHFRVIKDLAQLARIKKKYNLPDRFGLFTGNVNWNKNLVNISQACVDADLDLVLVGKSFENRSDLGHPEKRSYALFLSKYSNSALVHMLGFVPDEDLVAIYNLATVLVMPSFYEGFGMTMLEAQACGTPVVTSNISSIPEVVGKGATFVNPEKVTQISQAIEAILNDQQLRDNLIRLGFDNTKKFTWQKTALATAKIYQQVLK